MNTFRLLKEIEISAQFLSKGLVAFSLLNINDLNKTRFHRQICYKEKHINHISCNPRLRQRFCLRRLAGPRGILYKPKIKGPLVSPCNFSYLPDQFPSKWQTD